MKELKPFWVTLLKLCNNRLWFFFVLPDVTRVLPTMRYREPECEENGDFSPRQCHGNLCTCVHKDGTLVEGAIGDGQNLKCTRGKKEAIMLFV